jgi:hypothetical protein
LAYKLKQLKIKKIVIMNCPETSMKTRAEPKSKRKKPNQPKNIPKQPEKKGHFDSHTIVNVSSRC